MCNFSVENSFPIPADVLMKMKRGGEAAGADPKEGSNIYSLKS